MKIFIFISILYLTICALFNQNEVDEELIEQEFDTFVAKYNRMNFTMKEKERRLGIFKTNYILITEHNMRNEDWKMGVNQFTNMTPKEHRDMFHNLQVPKRINQEPKNPTDIFIDLNNNQTRSKEYKIDQRNETGKIINQLLCGSCYAFSAVESLQWEHFHATGKFQYLSQQQIVDCSLDFGNDGCQGGWLDQCVNYTQHVGILTADQYPYTAYFLENVFGALPYVPIVALTAYASNKVEEECIIAGIFQVHFSGQVQSLSESLQHSIHRRA